jgi:hypothetical protein
MNMPQSFYVGLAVAMAWLFGYCVPVAKDDGGQWDHLTPGVMQNAGCTSQRLAAGLSVERQWEGGNHLSGNFVPEVISIERS